MQGYRPTALFVSLRPPHSVSLDLGDKPHGHRPALEALGNLPLLSKALINVFNTLPKVIPGILSQLLDGMKHTGYTDKSFKVFNLGNERVQLNGCAIEMGLEYDKRDLSNIIDAVDEIFSCAARARAKDVYFSSPFALRFVAESEALLAMQYDRPTCMIEVPMLVHTYGFKEMMWSAQDALLKVGGRACCM